MGNNRVIKFDYNLIWVAKAMGGTVLVWGLLIALGWAAAPLVDQIAPSPDSTRRQGIATDGLSQSAPDNTDIAAVQPELTQDFLNASPLSTPQTNTKPLNSDISIVAVTKPGRDCSSSGNESQGSQNCVARDSSGSFSEATSNWENFGDEKKEQTVARHYNANGESAGEDTIRIKTNYRSNSEGIKQKEREFYDIVNQPPQGLISRDLIVKEYDKHGELKKITWAHYLEIGTRKAGLAHHAVLYYEDGKLTSGFANKYKSGKVIDTLLNYDPAKNPNLRIEKTGILKWAHWIDGLTQTLLTPAHN